MLLREIEIKLRLYNTSYGLLEVVTKACITPDPLHSIISCCCYIYGMQRIWSYTGDGGVNSVWCVDIHFSFCLKLLMYIHMVGARKLITNKSCYTVFLL